MWALQELYEKLKRGSRQEGKEFSQFAENSSSDSLGHHFAHIIGIEIRIGHLGRRGIVDGQVLDLATIVELRHCQPKQTQTAE